MDTLHQNLEHLYKSSLFNYISYGGIITIDESDVCAKVKKADIVYHGQVLKIDNVFLKGCHTIYDDIVVGNPELKHDCDGILFISNAHGKYFVLIELKSKYTEDNITKAEKQLAASYVRVLSHLLCIEGFNIDDYIKCGIIVSQAPDVKHLRKSVLKRNQDEKLSRYEKQMREFSKDGGCFQLDKKFVKFDSLPIRSVLKFDSLPVFHINVNENNNSVKFDINDILKCLHKLN